MSTNKIKTFRYFRGCISLGNWKNMEQKIRDVSVKIGRPLKIITHGVLSLNDFNGVPITMSLSSDNILPIPELIWKIVHDPSTEEEITFVVVNNPFQHPHAQTLLCESICIQRGCGTARWTLVGSGYLYCCTVAELLQVVTTASRLKVAGVLEGP